METTLKKIKETYAPSDQEIILKAYAYAEEAHANQSARRESRILSILAQLRKF